MPEFFIYYRAPIADEARVVALVRAWQQTLQERSPGCSARLLKRPAPSDSNDPQTWMETYRFDAVDAPGIDASELAEGPPALAALLIGPRHLEVFVPCAS